MAIRVNKLLSELNIGLATFGKRPNSGQGMVLRN